MLLQAQHECHNRDVYLCQHVHINATKSVYCVELRDFVKQLDPED